MIAREQEELFCTLRNRFHWTDAQTSGYIAGIFAASIGRLDPVFEHAKPEDIDDYGRMYLLAFAVRTGQDCEEHTWFGLLA